MFPQVTLQVFCCSLWWFWVYWCRNLNTAKPEPATTKFSHIRNRKREHSSYCFSKTTILLWGVIDLVVREPLKWGCRKCNLMFLVTVYGTKRLITEKLCVPGNLKLNHAFVCTMWGAISKALMTFIYFKYIILMCRYWDLSVLSACVWSVSDVS